MIYNLRAIILNILKFVEKRKFNKFKYALANSYKLNKGDIFTVTEKQFINEFFKCSRWFSPIKREKHIVWYKPSTWFRWYWVLEVVNE